MEDLVLLNGDKDSNIFVMNRIDYNKIMLKMIDDGIKNKIYEQRADSTLKDLKIFQDFLYKNFKDYENYDDTRYVSIQSAQLYHCYQIINESETFTYKAEKVNSCYLTPLCQNQYSISDNQQFPYMLSNLPPFLDHEEDVSYDVDSLFTNIPIKDTIEYII